MKRYKITLLCLLSLLMLAFCFTGCKAADSEKPELPKGDRLSLTDISNNTSSPISLEGYTLGMDGNISVNYYFSVTERTDMDSYVEFTVNEVKQIVKFSEAVNAENGYYKVTCELPAAEMADTIHAVVKAPDGSTILTLDDYSAVTYAASLLDGDYSTAAKDAVKAMLNYAAMAQTRFDHNTDKLANSILAKDERTVTDKNDSDIKGELMLGGQINGVSYYSSTLGLQSETVIYHYFKIPSEATIDDFNVACTEGLETEYEIIGGRLRVKMLGVKAADLGKTYTITVTKDGESLTLAYSPLRYAADVIARKGSYSGEVNLVRALYVYNKAAYTYVNSEYADLSFELLDDGTYELTGMNGTATIILVPEKYNGKAVTSIHTGAFKNNASIEKVVIPDSVTNIGNSVFSGCTALKELTLGNGIKVIGQKAFKDTAIKEVVLPDSLETVAQGAFEGTKLEKITLPFVGGSSASSKPYLGYIFGASSYGANSSYVPNTLKTVILSSACKEIKANAFDSCGNIENVVIGKNVTYIALYAFRNCTSLTSVTIPESVTSIPADEYAYNSPFYGCSEDLEITIRRASAPSGYGAYWNAISSEKFAKVTYKVNDYELPEVTPGEGSSSSETGSVSSSATLLPVKDGLDGIITIIHDDGDLTSARFLEEQFREKGLVGTLAVIANRIISLDGTLTADAAEWQRLVNTGLFDVSNHTQTHTYYGTTDKYESGTYQKKDGTVVSYQFAAGRITNETVGAAERLRVAFPGQRVITYIIPGFALAPGYEGRNDVALDIIGSNFIAQRNTGGTGNFDGVSVKYLNKIGDSNYESLNSLMVSPNNLSEWKQYVDNTITYKGWGIYCFHNIWEELGEGHVVLQSDASDLFDYISEKVKEKKIWCATFTDAALYTKEYQYATTKINASADKIEVSVTDGLDDEIYTMALTVKITIPESWTEFTLNGKIVSSSDIITESDGSRCIMTDIVPDVDTAVLEKIS